MIKVGDVVYHQLSKLYFICENSKHERWMNINPYYKLASKLDVSETYFKKNK